MCLSLCTECLRVSVFHECVCVFVSGVCVLCVPCESVCTASVLCACVW